MLCTLKFVSWVQTLGMLLVQREQRLSPATHYAPKWNDGCVAARKNKQANVFISLVKSCVAKLKVKMIKWLPVKKPCACKHSVSKQSERRARCARARNANDAVVIKRFDWNENIVDFCTDDAIWDRVISAKMSLRRVLSIFCVFAPHLMGKWMKHGEQEEIIRFLLFFHSNEMWIDGMAIQTLHPHLSQWKKRQKRTTSGRFNHFKSAGKNYAFMLVKTSSTLHRGSSGFFASTFSMYSPNST